MFETEAFGADAPDFCPRGCYWPCEHRSVSTVHPEDSRLRSVEDPITGLPLRLCRECGDYFLDAVEHAREHARLRQLGSLR